MTTFGKLGQSPPVSYDRHYYRAGYCALYHTIRVIVCIRLRNAVTGRDVDIAADIAVLRKEVRSLRAEVNAGRCRCRPAAAAKPPSASNGSGIPVQYCLGASVKGIAYQFTLIMSHLSAEKMLRVEMAVSR